MKRSLIVFLGGLCALTALSIYIGNPRTSFSNFTDDLFDVEKQISGGIPPMPPPVIPDWKR